MKLLQYRSDVIGFNLTMDRVVQSLELRFVQHKRLYKDVYWLSPAKIKTITEKDIKDETLQGIIKLFPQISKDQVILELFSFASNFDVLKLLLKRGENMDSNGTNCKICSPWPSCTKHSGIQQTSWQSIW